MISRELKNLLEKYQITLCDFYNTNTTDFVRNVIKIHNLNITVKDVLKK